MDKNGYGMLKLVRHRSGGGGGGDLDALLNAVMLRGVVHALLCVAALALGFSISREAVLVVVSFRLPRGSLLVKTTASVHGHHEVAIISFVRPEKKRPPRRAAPTSANPRGQEDGRLARAESTKLELHHTSSDPLISPSNSRVPVGRHEILIRPWPHPDPSQTLSAYRLLRLLQEEQQRPDLDLSDQKQLLVVTPAYAQESRFARLTSLSHTLRLVRGPLIWIVVEAGARSNGTDALLVASTLAFRHVGLPEVTPESGNLEARLQTEGLRFIKEHRLEGIVAFADSASTYNLNFFDEVRRVNWLGSFPIGTPPCTDTRDQGCIALQNKTDQFSIHRDPRNASVCDAYRYPLLANESNQGDKTMENLHWSDFALNAKVLWERPAMAWIKSWDEGASRNQTFLLRSPLDLVNNMTYMEPLGNHCTRKQE